MLCCVPSFVCRTTCWPLRSFLTNSRLIGITEGYCVVSWTVAPDGRLNSASAPRLGWRKSICKRAQAAMSRAPAPTRPIWGGKPLACRAIRLSAWPILLRRSTRTRAVRSHTDADRQSSFNCSTSLSSGTRRPLGIHDEQKKHRGAIAADHGEFDDLRSRVYGHGSHR